MKRILIAFIPIAVLVAVLASSRGMIGMLNTVYLINILSPLMSFAVALIGWKIERK